MSCKSNEEPAREIAGENPPAGNYTGDYSGRKEQLQLMQTALAQ